MKNLSAAIILITFLSTPLAAENPYLGVEQVMQTDAEEGQIDSAALHLRAEWERFGDTGELFIAADLLLSAAAPEQIQAEIDEAYGTLYTDFGDISAGRQRIAWGILDSLSVLDIVTAEDLRSYPQPWRQNERLAVDSLRWKYYGSRWFAEAVWEPALRLNKWTAQLAPALLYPENLSVEELAPEPSWANSALSGRICWYLDAADIGVQAGKSGNRDPLPLLEGAGTPEVSIREVQKTYYHAGAWSVFPLGDWILRTEGAYNHSLPILSDDATEVLREDRLHGALGIEWNGPAGLRLLLEGSGDFDLQAGDMQNSLEQHYMAGLSRSFFQDRLELETGGIYSTEIEGFGGELRAEYSLSDGITLNGGLRYLETEEELFENVAGTVLWFSLQWSM